MSNTPRTNAQLTSDHWNTYCLNEREGTEYVPASFARQLERELIQQYKDTAEMCDQAEKYSKLHNKALAKIEELRLQLATK